MEAPSNKTTAGSSPIRGRDKALISEVGEECAGDGFSAITTWLRRQYA